MFAQVCLSTPVTRKHSVRRCSMLPKEKTLTWCSVESNSQCLKRLIVFRLESKGMMESSQMFSLITRKLTKQLELSKSLRQPRGSQALVFLNNEVQLILGLKSDIISEKLLKEQNEQHGPAGHPGVADGGFSQQPCQVLIADNRQYKTFIPYPFQLAPTQTRSSGHPQLRVVVDQHILILLSKWCSACSKKN